MSLLRPDRRHGFRRTHSGPEHVTILMATRDGGRTIDAQMQSFAGQSHDDWSLIVSDDGSTDDTLVRVGEFSDRYPDRRVTRLKGPKEGSAMNFLSLLRAAGDSPFVAFSDQDDVWLPDRLARGLAALRDITGPAIYGSRTIIVDDDMTPLRLSPDFSKPPGFGNALVQNIAGGNTMLLNRAALDCLQPSSSKVRRLIAHDWWAYQALKAIGGHMIWDSVPTVLYRQHGKNQIGANDTLRASAHRAVRLFSGEFSEWCSVQAQALAPLRDEMTPEAKAQFKAFEAVRSRRLSERFAAFANAGLYRQSARGTFALCCAVALGRL